MYNHKKKPLMRKTSNVCTSVIKAQRRVSENMTVGKSNQEPIQEKNDDLGMTSF